MNKTDKPLARLIKKKGRNNKVNKFRNEKGEVITDNTDIQRIIREYYEQLYTNKMDNLENMNRYLEKISLPRLNQEEIEIMNNPIMNTETKTVIKKSPPKQKPRARWLHRGILSNIQRRANAYFSETSKKVQRKEYFQTHSIRPPSP